VAGNKKNKQAIKSFQMTNFTKPFIYSMNMGSAFLNIKLPLIYSDDDVKKVISRKLRIREFRWSFDLKSLDARQKNNIHWQVRLYIESDELKDSVENPFQVINIPFRKREVRVAVIGSGPAGFFAAEVLQKAGFSVTIFERGTMVEDRAIAIRNFESENIFSEEANYAYGEGGAGTFSDGKLTSRTKGISRIKQYILNRYTDAGAPDEIRYLSKPHIGSNHLRNVVMNLRNDFLNEGGEIQFKTNVRDFVPRGSGWRLDTNRGDFEFDILIWACGHSAYDTFRLLMSKGVSFSPKPFALGVRVEHEQSFINFCMWKKKSIEGLKSAEYALRWQGEASDSVYSFCMCPGGKIVQASPKQGLSMVNGMSNYQRNSPFANAAVVASVTPDELSGNPVSAAEMISVLEMYEQRVWDFSRSFAVPANRISSFIHGNVAAVLPETSYSHGIVSGDFSEFFPDVVLKRLKDGLRHFSGKLPGFEDGLMLGLESKTSCSVQVDRNENNGPCKGFESVYVTGEGSGFSGGIISSAADGIKTALNVMGSF
jgi:uncharacterized protein